MVEWKTYQMFEGIAEGEERRRNTEGGKVGQKMAKKANFRPRMKPNEWQARPNEL